MFRIKFLHLEKMNLMNSLKMNFPGVKNFLLHDLYPFISHMFILNMPIWAQELLSKVKGCFESAVSIMFKSRVNLTSLMGLRWTKDISRWESIA